MSEIVVIALVAIVLFPPTELPGMARSIARMYGSVRRTADEFRSTVLQDSDLREPIDEIRGAYREARWEARRTAEQARRVEMDARVAMRESTRAARDPSPPPPGTIPAEIPEDEAPPEQTRVEPPPKSADGEAGA
jgi:Sec-independent protein translocase protein TatA